MIEVLRQRPDLCAVLDVTYPKPPAPGSALYMPPSVVLTPHIARSLDAECRRVGRYMVDELKRCLRGEPLQWAISREEATRLAQRQGRDGPSQIGPDREKVLTSRQPPGWAKTTHFLEASDAALPLWQALVDGKSALWLPLDGRRELVVPVGCLLSGTRPRELGLAVDALQHDHEQPRHQSHDEREWL